MIYIDSSVALAHLLNEQRRLPDAVWNEQIVTSSRLLEYEVWNRLHAKGFAASLARSARDFIEAIEFVELTPRVLSRALMPFPLEVRTLDRLHLATADYLRSEGENIELATYDARILAAARALGIAIYEP